MVFSCVICGNSVISTFSTICTIPYYMVLNFYSVYIYLINYQKEKKNDCFLRANEQDNHSFISK